MRESEKRERESSKFQRNHATDISIRLGSEPSFSSSSGDCIIVLYEEGKRFRSSGMIVESMEN